MKNTLQNSENIALIDSNYTLLFYCLLFPKKIASTRYIVSDGVSKSVRYKLKNTTYLPDIQYSRFRKIKEVLRNIILNSSPLVRAIRKKQDVCFYGQDHAWFSFIGKDKPFILIEDGLDNYDKKYNYGIKRKILSYLGFPYLDMGRTNNITSIYLTGILPIPEDIKNKTKVKRICDLWSRLDSEEKQNILNLFISKNDMNKLKNTNISNSILLITQPLSQDNIISEEEKLSIYKRLILKAGPGQVFIKKHPRDTSDYSQESWIELYPSDCPIEIFCLLGLEFNTIVTFNSTAILRFPESRRISHLKM